jgi:predicted N-acetyltransferase YhbS
VGKIVNAGPAKHLGGPRLGAPELLGDKHDRTNFNSGKAILDDWLRRRAGPSDGLSARTFVVCDGARVVGYYCLSAGGIIRADALKKLQRNMPDPLPVIILGRLAVDAKYQGQRIGPGLLKDAILRVINISREVGVRGILVHALDDDAAAFYDKYRFLPCPVDPRTMILPIETAISAIS